jgi:hypothetical protein
VLQLQLLSPVVLLWLIMLLLLLLLLGYVLPPLKDHVKGHLQPRLSVDWR